MTTYDCAPEERFLVFSGRTDLSPGGEFTSSGSRWIALTHPIGKMNEWGIPVGMVDDPVNPFPKGTLLAGKVKE